MTSGQYSKTMLQCQSGLVLLFCLLFLTALTLLGLSASADTVIQNQLSANLQEAERARQSAMATLSWAENWVLGLEAPAPEPCVKECEGLYLHSTGALAFQPEFESLSWWADQGHEAGIDPLTNERLATIGSSGNEPSYWVIERLHEKTSPDGGATNLQTWYRILARGSGQTEAGVSVVESIVTRTWVSDSSHDHSTTGLSVLCPGSASASPCGRISWRELR